jgi:Na+/H+ antiporter NhaD/arsenite permease-like protein
MMIGIATEVLHRTWCALIGASFMLGLLMWTKGYPSLETVVSWIDDSTVCVLFGMMIIVGRLADTGVFEVMGGAIVRSSGGKMWVMTVYLMTAVAAVSAWLDNVTTMLLISPVTLAVMKRCERDPAPLLLALTFASNIGGAATMVGDPPALIIGTALSDYVGFVDFLANMAPGAVIAMIAATPLIVFVIFRGSLTGLLENYEDVSASTNEYSITDWPLLAKSSYVTFAVLLGFILHPIHHVDPSWFALLGAIVLCVSCMPFDTEKALRSVELDLLLFFAGLFVATDAAAEIGTIDMVAGWIESALSSTPEGAREIVSIQIFLWTGAIASAFLGAIPFTIAMVPVVEHLGTVGLGLDVAIMAWSLNFGACFGGNATPIGSAAGVVVCGLAEKDGVKIGLKRWLPSGTSVTLVTVAVADAWLLLRFCT